MYPDANRLTRRPMVSVVIPTWNRASLLKEALQSVVAQEGAGALFELEITVVDDGSTDHTAEVARQFPQARYIRLEKNSGISAARNAGIRASTGQYVAFLDDDDLWLPHRLTAQLPLMEAHPDVGVVYGHGTVTDEDGRVAMWPEEAPSGEVFEEFLTRPHDFVNMDTVLVRREAIDKAGLFDEDVVTMENYEWALRLAFHTRWLFVRGPVSHGRFSKQGNWFRHIISGQSEAMLPRIIEKALALLPDSREHDHVRQMARVAVCCAIADQRWEHGGGAETVRAHLVASVRTHPWMMEVPPIQEHFHRVVRTLAGASPRPIATARALWNDVASSVERPGLPGALRKRKLLAEFLLEAAAGVRKAGSPRLATLIALYAFLCKLVSLAPW